MGVTTGTLLRAIRLYRIFLRDVEICAGERPFAAIAHSSRRSFESMNIRTTKPQLLTPEELGAWRTMQADAAHSPFFRPEFTQAVAAVRDDVEVAVLDIQQQPVGFFPYQRSRRNVARPVAGRMSDFQAMIAFPGFHYDPMAVLQCLPIVSVAFRSLAGRARGLRALRVARSRFAVYRSGDRLRGLFGVA